MLILVYNICLTSISNSISLARPLISISLNKNSNYCYTSVSRKVVLQTGKSLRDNVAGYLYIITGMVVFTVA